MTVASIEFGPEFWAEFDRRVAAVPQAESWLNAKQAAEYLACSQKRIQQLVQAGTLRHAREGARLMFRREWLDEVVR